MSSVTTSSVVRQIGSLFDGGSIVGLTDRQLIDRFNDRRDATAEAAFAALVTRHGPMIMRVCRQLLDDHYAEDAFQAVFLVLACKARSIRDPDKLGNWLYGVALRTAKKARGRLARPHKNEVGGAMRHPVSSSGMPVERMVEPAERRVLAREQAEILHREIDRLPGPFRQPIVLCYFEGLTLEEAAHRLRCPAGTVRSRLARACEKLRRGLTRRGVVLSGAGLVATLSSRCASASVSSLLCDTTTKAAIAFAAGQAASPLATSIAQEVLRAMLIYKLRFTLLTLLTLGAIAVGGGYLSHSSAMMKDGPQEVPAVRNQPAVKSGEPTRTAPSPSRMTVTGRVLDPAGKPVAGAPVDVVGVPRQPRVAATEDIDPIVVLGHGQTDGDGRFRLDGPRTTSDSFFEVYAVTAAPGVEWARLNPDASQPTTEIRLKPEQVIRGRLVDVTGQPAAGVEVRVRSIGRPSDIGRLEGVYVWDTPPAGLRIWPRPVKTDDQGRFVIGGIGRGCFIALAIRDFRFAEQTLQVQTDDRDAPKEIRLALLPATIIEGRTLAADTGQPIAKTILDVAASQQPVFGGLGVRRCADARGRFFANVEPGKYIRIQAFPPEGQPYLVLNHQFDWVDGQVKKVMDVRLPRGVLIRGRVTEEGIGRPVAQASVQYMPIGDHDNILSGWQAIVASKEDGSFQIAVPPGKGHLLVFGPASNYILEEIGLNALERGQPGGPRFYAHNIIAYEVRAGDPPHVLAAVLRPGRTVRGRVVGPGGEAVNDVAIMTKLHIEPINPSWRGDFELHARDGQFVLHGLDPLRSAPVYFLDADHRWGATVDLSGKQAGELVTVRLQPNGQANTRFVGPDRKPVANHTPHFEILASVGRHRLSFNKTDQSQLAADDALMVNVDRKYYWMDGRKSTDTEGRITLPDLIPGALYRICDSSTLNDPNKGIQVRKDFTVKPGETLDLGDILIEKPQP